MFDCNRGLNAPIYTGAELVGRTIYNSGVFGITYIPENVFLGVGLVD